MTSMDENVKTEPTDVSAADTPAPENVLFPDDKKPEQENADQDVEKNATEPEGEDKAEGEDKGEDKGEKDPLDTVPEDGNYELKMPDGVEVDKELSQAIGAEFKELGLTHRQAQKLADKYIAVMQQREQQRWENFSKTVAKWADEAKSDSEIGGENWNTTVENARRAVAKFGTPKLREYFDATGGGNHPEVIRFMAKVGAMIREDKPATGGAVGAGKPADPAHILFPDDAPKAKG